MKLYFSHSVNHITTQVVLHSQHACTLSNYTILVLVNVDTQNLIRLPKHRTQQWSKLGECGSFCNRASHCKSLCLNLGIFSKLVYAKFFTVPAENKGCSGGRGPEKYVKGLQYSSRSTAAPNQMHRLSTSKLTLWKSKRESLLASDCHICRI